MKLKLNTKYLLVLLGMWFTSCNMLDVEPYDAIPAEEVLSTKKGLEGSLIGAYNILQSASISTDALVFADLAADVFIARGSKAEYREISMNDIQASNSYVEALWNNSYNGINLVNNIIASVDNVKGITEVEKQEFLAQSYFLRAFHYFNLVRYFKDIPLRLNPVRSADPTSLNIAATPEAQIYQQIISDLKLAEQFMAGKGIGNNSFANEGAAKSLLAKVYLYTKDWANAVSKANEVLSMNYALESDFINIFNEGVPSREIIFKIDFSNSQEASNLLNNWLTPDGRWEVAVWKNNNRTASLIDEFEPSDERKDATVKYYSGAKGLDYYCTKYLDKANGKDNPIILRLAEIYLIKAEALNEQAYTADGDAFNALNQIRLRAGLSSLSSTEIPNQDAFRLAIEKERLLELAGEGNRLFDLRRTNRINSVIPDFGTLKEAGWYFPIPQTELDANESL